jgi:hypothetical protein
LLSVNSVSTGPPIGNAATDTETPPLLRGKGDCGPVPSGRGAAVDKALWPWCPAPRELDPAPGPELGASDTDACTPQPASNSRAAATARRLTREVRNMPSRSARHDLLIHHGRGGRGGCVLTAPCAAARCAARSGARHRRAPSPSPEPRSSTPVRPRRRHRSLRQR